MIGTTAAIIAGSLAAGGAVGSAAIKSRAAGKAANTQSAAAQQVGADAVRTSNEVADNVTGVSNSAADSVDAATAAAIEGIRNGTIDANALLRDVYDTAGTETQPYRTAGANAVTTLADLVSGPGSQFQFSEDDPSYQWRFQQGQKALERSAAARGSLLGGGALKELTRYGQGAASQEYAAAFDRFMKNKNTNISGLNTLIGAGQTATGQYINAGTNYGNQASGNLMDAARLSGVFGTQGAETAGRFRIGGANSAGGFRMQGQSIAGNAITGAANANAAGTMASGNAWGDALSGGTNNIAQMILLSDLLKKPATTPKP